MASLANTVIPSQLITGNIKLKDGVYSTQNLQQSDLSINLKDVLTNGSSLPKSELNYEARNIIKDKDQNLYIFGVYGFKDGNLNGGGLGPGNNFKTIGKFIAKIDASANIVYIKDEDPNIQAPWYQTPLIATDSSGSLSLAVNIDNSGGMPSQDGKDVSYAGITLNSNRGGFVKRIAGNGDVKWVAPVTGSDIYSYLQSIITDDSGNTYVYWGDINWWAGKNITKLDAYGNTVWTANTFGGGSAYAPYASFVGIDQSGDPLLAADNGRGSTSLFKVNKDSGIAESLGIAVSQDEWRNFSFISPNNKPTGTPTLSGTSKAGQVITIDRTPIQDADNFTGYIPDYKYSWEVSSNGTTWTPLTTTDATDNNNSYTLTTAEVGKQVRGVVSYLDGYGTNERVASIGSSLVQASVNLDIGTTTTTANKTTTLAPTISRLILTGTGNINGTGNALNNYLTGNDGNNILDGGAGNDILAGGKGNDTYIVNSIYDSIIENTNEGIDLVKSSVNWTLGANVENLTLTGTASLTGTGNEFNNTIIGNSGNNVLDGGAGNDTLEGSTGNDTLIGGLGNDVMKGGSGNDTYYVDSTGDTITDTSGTDTVVVSISWTLDSKLENLTLAGTDPLTGIGNAGKNTIIGNAGNNVLDGMGGTDILTGGSGADVFRFSTRPNFGSSTADHITDFKGAEGDVLQINKAAFGLAANATVSLTTVGSATELTTALGSASTFIYDSSSGNLYWNQNGTKSGFGSGGIFAVLDNHAALSSSNIALV